LTDKRASLSTIWMQRLEHNVPVLYTLLYIHNNYSHPRINAQCTSLSWFIFNLHTTNM
jgi:hypothetical protein